MKWIPFINVVTSANRKLEATNHDQFDRLNRLESSSRRSNLIFSNVQEYQTPIINIVRNIFAKMGIRNPNNIVLDNMCKLGAAKATRENPYLL